MMTDKAKQKIFDTYKDCKIIFCGDPGYQMPQFQKDEKCISLTGFDNVILPIPKIDGVSVRNY